MGSASHRWWLKCSARPRTVAMAVSPGSVPVSSKRDQYAALTSPWCSTGTLARMLRARWITQRWRRLWGNTNSTAAMRPGAPSEMTSSGARRPRVINAVEEAAPGVGGLRRARLQAHQHRAALGGHAPGGQHRLGPGAVVVVEVVGGRTEARCRCFNRSFPRPAPPNRTCALPRIRLSTSPCRWTMRRPLSYSSPVASGCGWPDRRSE